MKTKVRSTDDGFNEIYDVNFLQFKMPKEIFEKIKHCWNYLENKVNIVVELKINHGKLPISSDDNDFYEAIRDVTIHIFSSRIIYLECSDFICRSCESHFVSELELIESQKAK